jgi:hypothetical protein
MDLRTQKCLPYIIFLIMKLYKLDGREGESTYTKLHVFWLRHCDCAKLSDVCALHELSAKLPHEPVGVPKEANCILPIVCGQGHPIDTVSSS